MIIRTPEQRLAVLRVLWSSENEEICLCQDLSGKEDGISTLLRFKDSARSRLFLPILMEAKENSAFEDFLGMFTQDGNLCVRFRYSEAPTLAELLEQDRLNLTEKLVVGKNILERAALLDMPPAILFDVLRAETITADEAMRVKFRYELKITPSSGQADIGFICVRTSQLMRKLFEKELAAKSLPEAEELISRLEKAVYSSYLEIYADYCRMKRAIEERNQAEPVKPRTWLFRFWEKVKKLTKYIKPVLGGIVLIAAFCYLIYTLLAPPRPKGPPIVFDNIGTVEIQSESKENSAP